MQAGAQVIRLTAIVSGGQTGADRGGLDAAIQLGLGWGGWAPNGWRAEDGAIPEIYRAHMRETSSPDYGMRTRLNVQDSDGTLIVSFGHELIGGSALTGKTCKTQRKPAKHLVLPGPGGRLTEEVRAGLLDWVNDKGISVLNVAGPRESKEPGLQQAVRDALVWIFEDDGGTLIAPTGADAVEVSASNHASTTECEPQALIDLAGEKTPRTAWVWCGGCQVRRECPVESCTSHKDAPYP